MALAVFLVVLLGIYGIKMTVIAKQYDEIIADDVAFSWMSRGSVR